MGTTFRLSQIGSGDAHDAFVEALDDRGIPQLTPGPKKAHHRAMTGLRRQLIDQVAAGEGRLLHVKSPSRPGSSEDAEDTGRG